MDEEKQKTVEGLISRWGAPVEAAVCERCDWRYLALEGQMPEDCPNCFQPGLVRLGVQVDQLPYAHPPELLLRHNLSTDQLADHITGFARGIPFAPHDLAPGNLNSRLLHIYLPMWLVDSQIEATWQAEIGFDYQVISHQDRFDQYRGGWSSRQVEETRVRWEPRLGRLERTYHNVVAPALEDSRRIEAWIGNFDLAEAGEYHQQALAGALVRLPDREPGDAWEAARPAFHSLAANECRRAAGGDHLRNYSWNPEYGDQHWSLLLLPVYRTYYLDDENRPQQVWIHARTGRMHGSRRASMKRARQASLVVLLVALFLFLLGGGLSAGALLMPALLPVGLLGLGLSLVVGLGAIFPVATVWWFNKGQSDQKGTQAVR
jgi:hypothetical protein